MPKQEQFFLLNSIDRETALATSYQAFKNLDWDILAAGSEIILAQTTKKRNSNPQRVVVTITDTGMNVRSEMIKNEMADIFGKNKKNINAFYAAFEMAKITMNTEVADFAKKEVAQLQTDTAKAVEQQKKDNEEVDKAMNLSGSNLYITYAIVTINVIVFVLMAINGAGIFEPNPLVHINWGSNYSFLTLSGDWWRLFTNIFLHFGIIHLIMNMYALYMVGVYLEPMLGKARFIAAYLACGILASITSLWWHKEGVNSAGASGAIFGMYGLFLALLTSKLIPETVKKTLLQSTAVFVVYNLLYGMKGGIDNSAHIGGLISGFITGQLYITSLKKERQGQPLLKWMAPVVLISASAVSFFYLKQNNTSASERKQILRELESEKYVDSKKFNNKLLHFDEMHEKALSVYNNPQITDAALKDSIEMKGLRYLDTAANDLKEAQKFNLSPDDEKKRQKLIEYIEARREEMKIIVEMIDDGNPGAQQKKLEEVRKKADKLFNQAIGKE